MASFSLPSVKAHQVPYTRVIHTILHDDTLEIYINFLLPTHPKMRVWMALFDRDRDGKLDANEQIALGRFLAPKIVHRFALLANKKVCSLILREIQNSRWRGDPLQKKYSWDLRFQIPILSLQTGLNRLRFSFPLLSAGEEVPIALITKEGFAHRTLPSQVASPSRPQAASPSRPQAASPSRPQAASPSRPQAASPSRPQAAPPSQTRSLAHDRSICRIHGGNPVCTFWIEKLQRSSP